MQIVSKPISVEQCILQDGAGFMEETSKRLQAQCSRLDEADRRLCTELEGNVQTCFLGAALTARSKVQMAEYILSKLSVLITDYTREMAELDKRAALRGGGGGRR